MTIKDSSKLTLGLDIGIGSCGWAILRDDDHGHGEILGLGVRTFDVPETDKERTPTNQIRRQNRLMRRVLKRRRQRMNAIRALFKSHGLLTSDAKSALALGLDPWALRAEGLERKLKGEEFAVALAHIAKHRGFKSNSKRDKGKNAPDDSSKMLGAIEATKQRLSEYRTVGEMFAKDAFYAGRKRNRDGDYTRSVLRDDQEREVRLLFDIQRRAGNAPATKALEEAFIQEAFFQRPLQDSEHLVGTCPFEPAEKRAAKHAQSFEMFRVLSRLNALRIKSGRDERALTPDEIAIAAADFGRPGFNLTYKNLRKLLDLDDGLKFDVSEADEKHDIASRSGDSAAGTKSLRKVLGDAWKTLAPHPEKIDRIAFVLAFREDIASIRKGLEEVGLEPLILDALMKGVDEGDFNHFKGSGHISAKAARAMIPHLKRGLVYSEAAAAAGYDHSKQSDTGLDAINNPIAKKSIREAMKQVKAITECYGLPGRIHIELARDVGKSKEERDEIKRGIDKRNRHKDILRDEFKSTIGREVHNAEDLLRFELWKEQQGRCLYTDEEINPAWIVSSDRRVEVDHILPWSRSGDDSFINKTLCLARANQEKKGRTPFEWFGDDEKRWAAFTACVESIKYMKGRKKRNYLLKNAAVLEEKFRSRNLNDTRYATRVVMNMLTALYPEDARVHVFARPGALTSRLRNAWGIQGLKKDAEGKRIEDDRHHALDALICAATSQSALQALTRAAQREEVKGSSRFISDFPPPWPGFIEEAKRKLAEVFVSRAERRRARGEAHAATVRQIAVREGETIVYERKSVEALGEKDLERIKDKERNHKTVAAIAEWIAAGKPKGTFPRSPQGHDIRKVRLTTNNKPDVLIRDGAADRGEMVRVDVFRKQNKKGKWEFFLVPIYPHQVADREAYPEPPNKYAVGGKSEAEWPEIGEGHEFLWSIWPMSFLEIEKGDGTFIDGYFRGLNRWTASVAVSPQMSSSLLIQGIGVKTLKTFRKLSVDRLGRRHEIHREQRTWHGEVCT